MQKEMQVLRLVHLQQQMVTNQLPLVILRHKHLMVFLEHAVKLREQNMMG